MQRQIWYQQIDTRQQEKQEYTEYSHKFNHYSEPDDDGFEEIHIPGLKQNQKVNLQKQATQNDISQSPLPYNVNEFKDNQFQKNLQLQFSNKNNQSNQFKFLNNQQDYMQRNCQDQNEFVEVKGTTSQSIQMEKLKQNNYKNRDIDNLDNNINNDSDINREQNRDDRDNNGEYKRDNNREYKIYNNRDYNGEYKRDNYGDYNRKNNREYKRDNNREYKRDNNREYNKDYKNNNRDYNNNNKWGIDNQNSNRIDDQNNKYNKKNKDNNYKLPNNSNNKQKKYNPFLHPTVENQNEITEYLDKRKDYSLETLQ